MSVAISGIRFRTAPEHLRSTGLIGWVSLLIGDAVRVDGIALRKSATGRLVLAYPLRQDGVGREYYAAKPIDDRAREEIESQVFAALRLDQGRRR